MTTAYTSLLGLALPVTGELSGTWGDTVNNSITSLLDSAVAGTTTLSSDVDVTLTTTTGAANTSREAILLWTAGGTVTRNITAPAQSKVYVVINASSSTQSIVLRGVGPTTGVTIVQGEKAVCAWNGSDFVKVANISGPGVFTTLNCTTLTATADSTFSSTGAVTLSKGTTAQQPGSPVTGMLRYNTTTNQFEGYSGASPAWASVGGAAISNDTATSSFEYPLFAAATSGTALTVYTSNAKFLYKPSTGELQASEITASNGLLLNATTVAASYTIGTGYNAMSVGPVTVASGQSVTVSSGQRWLVF
jgi:hypothetical protein